MNTIRHDLGHFALVPEWIATSVSSAAVKLWCRLWIYTGNGSHEAWPSQSRLADEMGCSPRTVQRILDELESAGALSVRNRHGTSSVYTLHWHPSYPQDKNGQGTYDTSVVGGTTLVSYKERQSEIDKQSRGKHDNRDHLRTPGDAPLTREQIRHIRETAKAEALTRYPSVTDDHA